jgi:thiamine-monophosphate kinase
VFAPYRRQHRDDAARAGALAPTFSLVYDGAVPLPEKALIRRIRDLAAKRRGPGLGIGDDCAVLPIPRGHEALITTDFCVENVHFKRAWHPPESVGHRCLARGLSDIAAMGGKPLAMFLSLAVPRSLPQSWIDGFLRGLLKLADEFKVTLAGGDTAESRGGVLVDVVGLGSVPNGKAVLRSGARPGDRIYVTGELGASAAAIALLSRGKKLRRSDFFSHFYPRPRAAVGRVLRERGLASAMIDISDGFSTDLGHICEESGVGAEVETEAIPVAAVGKPARRIELDYALHGGEDYELLFTVPSRKRVPSRIAGVVVRQIGVVTGGRQMFLVDKKGVRRKLRPQGWEHFNKGTDHVGAGF